MRRPGPPSELLRLAAPLTRGLDAAWQRMEWWIGAMAVLYLLSGLTVVRSSEVAVVLRWGRLIGGTHAAGLMFAFPWPMDEVIRVPVKHVSQISINTLWPSEAELFRYTLDPRQGYALTGDQNIVHVQVVARYRVRDPVDWALYGPKADDALRLEITAALVRSLGEMQVDRVLAEDRRSLLATAKRRSQAGLDAIHCGLELMGLEVTHLGPPGALASDFDAVQTAFIAAETAKKRAEEYAQRAVPAAQATADHELQKARGEAAADLAIARGAAGAFLALDEKYRKDPAVMRARLYREGVEQAVSQAAGVRWLPPPVGQRYGELRISIDQVAPGPKQHASGQEVAPKAPDSGEGEAP